MSLPPIPSKAAVKGLSDWQLTRASLGGRLLFAVPKSLAPPIYQRNG